jgi:hypothetical protein
MTSRRANTSRIGFGISCQRVSSKQHIMASVLAHSGSVIMPVDNAIVRERQLVIRRQLDARKISLKAISMDSGVPYPTVISYFPGEENREPATMSAAALFALCEAKSFPLDLLSMMLPDGFQIVRAPEDVDHDQLCELAAEYVAEKNRAHHPESEAGRDIGPGERTTLTGKAVRLVGSVAA